jgi:hypothetical protein
MPKATPVPRGQLTGQVNQLIDECGGVLQIHVIQAEHLPPLAIAAALGDQEAGELAAVVCGALEMLEQERRHCLCCDTLLNEANFEGGALCVMLPDQPNRRGAIASPLCRRCTEAPDRHDRLQASFLRIWPRSRELPNVHPPGHA